MIDIYEDDSCKLYARNPADAAHRRVLLSFTGVGHKMGGMDIQRPEFFATGKGFDNVIFLSDAKRSWGNSLDFKKIVSLLTPYVEGSEICSIGNSMGGFLSVVATRYWPIEIAVAVSPQYSVSSNIIPNETRWKHYTKNIGEYHIPSLEKYFNTSTRYYLLSSETGPDRRHWRRFPQQDNVRNIVFTGSDHNLARALKEEGSLGEIITACLDGKSTTDLLGSMTNYTAKQIGG